MSRSDERFTVEGFRVGHWTHPEGGTGCTVVLTDSPALAIADVRGGAPGSRELAVLGEGRLVQRVDAVLLTGGSAFGLAAADGVMAWLREHGRGFPTSSIPVPIVPAAVIFDLVGPEPAWPDAAAGYQAANDARPDGWRSGRIGAGAGATVGKLLGADNASPAGLGAACVGCRAGRVAAIVAVNAVGDVVDPASGQIVAGARAADDGGGWADSEALLLSGAQPDATPGTNTVIGVVVVDAAVDRDALVRIGVAAHDGLARAIRPAHTTLDGDTLFVLAREEGRIGPSELLQLGTAAQQAVAHAVHRSVQPY